MRDRARVGADVTWLTRGHADVPASLGYLAVEERTRLATMRIAKRRDDYLLGRWTAKCAIAARLSPQPPLWAIAIRAADDGAPEVILDGAPLELAISLSHSAGRALVAVHDGTTRLGADLERVEPRSALLVDQFFTAEEAAQIAACPPALRDHAITLIWSAKESALKALRCGLRADTRSVHVTLGDGLPCGGIWHPLQVAIDGAPALGGWWRDDAGYVLTIVGEALTAPPVVRSRGTQSITASPAPARAWPAPEASRARAVPASGASPASAPAAGTAWGSSRR